MEFITYKSPSDRKSGRTKHAVRSHIAKRQHRLRREAEDKALGVDESRIDDVEGDTDQTSNSVSEKSAQHDDTVSIQHVKPQSTRRGPATKDAQLLMRMPLRLPPQVSQQLMLPCRSVLDTLESFIHVTMVPAHVAALGLNPSPESEISSQWFSSASMDEPALYTSALLTATAGFRQVSPDLIFYLKSTTISSLVKALACDERRASPALILAVECLTFYECLHGDQFIAQKVHRPAMRKLIQAQGGRDRLQVPRSWKKVSLMADIVMEIQMGSEGESSFLSDERHENASILETEWTDALKIYLPDVGEGSSENGLPTRKQESQTSGDEGT